MKINFTGNYTPIKGTEFSAGYDLKATSKKDFGDYIEYGTGLFVEIPEGYYGKIVSRSSVTSKTDLILGNGSGVIDSDYRGEIKFQFRRVFTSRTFFRYVKNVIKNLFKGDFNLNNASKYREYEIGDRVGQIIIQKYEDVNWNNLNILSETKRGKEGFGSTGK